MTRSAPPAQLPDVLEVVRAPSPKSDCEIEFHDSSAELAVSESALREAVLRVKPHVLLLCFASDSHVESLARLEHFWLPAVDRVIHELPDVSVIIVSTRWDLAHPTEFGRETLEAQRRALSGDAAAAIALQDPAGGAEADETWIDQRFRLVVDPLMEEFSVRETSCCCWCG